MRGGLAEAGLLKFCNCKCFFGLSFDRMSGWLYLQLCCCSVYDGPTFDLFYSYRQVHVKARCPKTEWFIFALSVLAAAIILLFVNRDVRRSFVEGEAERVGSYLDGIDRLLPHRALYDVKMTAVKSGSNVQNIIGQLVYVWQPHCEGVVTDYRFDLRYQYSDLTAVDVRSHISNHEPYQTPRLDFVTQSYTGPEPFSYMKGYADLDQFQAHYTTPSPRVDVLPRETLFPTAYTLRLLDTIQAGETFMHAALFDGSDESGPMWVNSFIGETVRTGEGVSELPEAVDRVAFRADARRVRMAFFGSDTDASVPDYEMSAIFYQNGVMRDVNIEYDDFSVSQNLVSLEVLNKNACQ